MGPDWRPVELFLEFPGSGSSSPFVQRDRTWLRTDFLGVLFTQSIWDCQMIWSTSLWSLSWVKTAQRDGVPLGWRRTRNTIRWHTTLFGPMSPLTLVQPSCQLVAQGASQLESLWGLQMLWQYSQRRNQATLRGVENSGFNFTLAGPDVYLCLSPEQTIHRIFKRQCRASGYKKCALP
jgi:hypothetical protein